MTPCKFLLKLPFSLAMVFLLCRTAVAQVVLDVDSFTINGAKFIVTTPAKWASIKTQNEIQPDTSWNYVGQYLSDVNGTVARMAIQIINNTQYTPTAKEQRNFKKHCTVSATNLDGHFCYLLDYDGVKDKACKKCPLIYTQVYSMPLNPCQTLNAVFTGQGAWNNVYQLEITFKHFLDGFIADNTKGLANLNLIDLITGVTKDTFSVKGYYLNVMIPRNFNISRQQSIGGSSYTLLSTASCNQSVSIHVSAQLIDSSSGRINYVTSSNVDTSISVRADGFSNLFEENNLATHYTAETKRIIPIANGQFILLTISCAYLTSDPVWANYYSDIVRHYANQLVADNRFAKKSPPVIITTPDLKPKPKNALTPIKFNTTMPGSGPK